MIPLWSLRSPAQGPEQPAGTRRRSRREMSLRYINQTNGNKRFECSWRYAPSTTAPRPSRLLPACRPVLSQRRRRCRLRAVGRLVTSTPSLPARADESSEPERRAPYAVFDACCIVSGAPRMCINTYGQLSSPAATSPKKVSSASLLTSSCAPQRAEKEQAQRRLQARTDCLAHLRVKVTPGHIVDNVRSQTDSLSRHLSRRGQSLILSHEPRH